MKKFVVILLLLFFSVINFSDILESVSIENLKTVTIDELRPLYENYVGFDVNENAINNIVSSIKATGYFSNVELTKIATDNHFELIINVEENAPVSKVNLNIYGVELISKETLQASITLKEGKAFSFVQFKKSIENLTELYQKENYIVSNVFSKNKEQAFVYITGEIDNSNVDFNITEYALYDLEFTGNINGLEYVIEKIKKDVDFKLYKNYLKKNAILKIFDSKKDYYPKFSDIQKLYQTLSNYVYFSPLSNIQFEPVSTEIPAKVLRVFAVQNLLVKEPVYIENVIVNSSLYDFNNLTTTPATFTNLDLLKLVQAVKDRYDKDEYFINLNPVVKGHDFIIDLIEYKFGDLKIEGNTRTKTYIFDDLIKIKPGDYASRKTLRETYVEIYKTQFFESVDFNITPSSTNILDTTLTLKEKEKKFNFMGGGTWAPPEEGKKWYEGFAAQLQLSTTNPFGYGQTFSSNFSLGFSGRVISLNYGIRKPFGKPFSLSTGLSYKYQPTTNTFTDGSTETTTSTNLTNFNFNFSLSSLKINNFKYSLGAGINYKIEETTISTSVDSTQISSSTSSIEYTGANVLMGVIYENLDDLIIPSNGIFVSATLKKYFNISGNAPVALKAQEEFSLHFPIKNTYFGFATRFYAAQIFQQSGEDVTNYLSGLNSVRGADLSGDMVLLLNNDFRYINKDGEIPFFVALFFDAGYAGNNYDFSTPFEWSTGLELGLNVPMFGLIRVGEAYYNNNWNFYFLMGKTF